MSSAADGPSFVYTNVTPDHDHVHDHEVVLPIEDNPIWQQDNVELTSVGIDVGSSGTQVIFSNLLLRRIGEELSSRFIVVRRDTWYRSPVELTPYRPDDQIDAEALGRMIDAAYAAAKADPARIDTGVVILTGEALRRRNAARITQVLSEQGGELVCATAGHKMEAMLAAYGSGAAQRSYEQSSRILNIDIGGGTTKLGLVERGQVLETAAVDVGGRLVAVDDDAIIRRLEPSGRAHACRAGLSWEPGDTATEDQRSRVGAAMADALVDLLVDREGHGLRVLAGPLPARTAIDGVMFSGGVGEYVYGRESRDFGDLGPALGGRLRERIEDGSFPFPVLPPGECIRATALGASEYSIQLSGSTGYISDPDRLLPRRNLQVVRPDLSLGDDIDPQAVAVAVAQRLEAFDLDPAHDDVALALGWSGLPSYPRLHAFARGVADAMRPAIEADRPLVLVLDADVARSVGRLLREELEVKSDVLCIDGVRLWDFDFVDLGTLRFPSNTVPVTIKSLLFSDGANVDGDHDAGRDG
ncbi:ethanolamine ammonia-lyase reactivating factor EutA [Egicoccus sp. AB-alg2]|uniref:ethanolamine ammonia-lyase reactivating factor EutA n=1 Tax=Egicoccus sp. AB-alg2 TaxID=3242693 RepID=UPI00359F0FEB